MKQRLFLVAFGSLLGLFAFLLLDLSAGLAIKSQRDVLREGTAAEKEFILKDPALGYRPKPSCSLSARERSDKGEVLYDVTYSIDSLSRRVTPQRDHQAERFALFFGCSFAFGEGLADDQTLPAAFARLAPQYAVYNYAFGGYGPQQLYMRLGDAALRQEISQPRGVLVYTFIDAHVERLIGSSYVYNGWCQDCPYLALDPNGRVAHRGSFTSGRPLRSAFYWLLSKSLSARLFRIGFPRSITGEDVAFTAQVVQESKERFVRMFPGSEFYVLLYPGSEYAAQLKSYLEPRGVKTIDLSQLHGFQEVPYIIHQKDPHPSGLANEKIAEALNVALQGAGR